jgi:hypothetical protein
MINFRCPFCDYPISAFDNSVGLSIECPGCQRQLEIENAALVELNAILDTCMRSTLLVQCVTQR